MSDRTNQLVLFVCQGNACRSPIAEGYGRSLLDEYRAESAGIRPIGVDERTIQVMSEDGIDIRNITSSGIDDISHTPDLMVCMSPSVARKLPSTQQTIDQITWDIDDPYHAKGPREKQLQTFRTVRDDIKQHVKLLNNG